jgi:tetrahydromethanopterin S-methyltransferase subunit B
MKAEEQEYKKYYEKTLKPLFKKKQYGLVSDLTHNMPKLKQYMSKEELKTIMDYYERQFYGIVKGLEALCHIKKLK